MIAEEIVLTPNKEFAHATVSTVAQHPGVLVLAATKNYIPIEEFKEIFAYIGGLVKKQSFTKLVFDKRALTVFHQPSMEWYFIEWKEEMFGYGLTTHRKLLPEDTIFRESVKIGRSTINRKFPEGKYHQMDIQYFESLDEAIIK